VPQSDLSICLALLGGNLVPEEYFVINDRRLV